MFSGGIEKQHGAVMFKRARVTIFISIISIFWDGFWIAYYKITCQLTLPAPCILESRSKIKINLNFYFPTSLWCLKRFYEGIKAFFEAPQRSVKIKLWVIFFSSPGIGVGKVKINLLCETVRILTQGDDFAITPANIYLFKVNVNVFLVLLLWTLNIFKTFLLFLLLTLNR